MIAEHLAYITLIGHRPRTITSRREILTAFAQAVHPRSLATATRRDVERFLGRDHLSPSSRRTYLGHLRSLYRWALEQELVAEDPTARIRSITVKPGLPRPVTVRDLALALDRADPQMRAMLLLMGLAGLRCMEVSGLRPGDLFEIDGHVLLFLRECKGGGSATVPAHPAILEALACLPIRDDAWWTMSPNTISTKVSQYLHGLGIDASAHMLRHGFATAALEASGHDLLTTARLMRHANVNNTQIYAQINPARPAEVVNLLPVPRTERRGKPATKWTPVIKAYGEAMRP